MDGGTEKKGEKRETDSGDILLNLSLQILDAVVKVIFELTVREGERGHSLHIFITNGGKRE